MTAGQTITLISNCETGSEYTKDQMLALTEQNVTLDLNGYTITETNKFSFAIAGNNDVVKNGYITSGSDSDKKKCGYHSYAMVVGAMTQGQKITGVKIQNVVFTGGISVGGSTDVGDVSDCKGDAEVTFEGCTITSGEFYVICAQPTQSKAIIKSGTYNRYAGVTENPFYVYDGCSIELQGGTYNFDPSGYVATHYEAVNSGDTWTVEKTVLAPGSGVFTIDANGTKVKFSQGNLYYDGSAWGFESNQYDYRTYEGSYSCINGNVTGNGTPAGTWGLFGWVGASSTSLTNDPAKYGVSNTMDVAPYGNVASESLKADWADIPSLPQVTGREWKTMTSSEWTYLLNTREVNGGTGQGKSYLAASIKCDGTSVGIYGLIIYPDNYTSQTSATTYTSSQWETMESAGCVFLPAACYRNGTIVGGYREYGYYWSSSACNASYAYCVLFKTDSWGYKFNSNKDWSRTYGCSVRLVSVATE